MWRRVAATLAMLALLIPVLSLEAMPCDEAGAVTACDHASSASVDATHGSSHDTPLPTPGCDDDGRRSHCATHCARMAFREVIARADAAGASGAPIVQRDRALVSVSGVTDTPPPKA